MPLLMLFEAKVEESRRVKRKKKDLEKIRRKKK